MAIPTPTCKERMTQATKNTTLTSVYRLPPPGNPTGLNLTILYIPAQDKLCSPHKTTTLMQEGPRLFHRTNTLYIYQQKIQNNKNFNHEPWLP